MQNDKLRKQHIQSFAKLSLSERLSWAFMHHNFLLQFRDEEAKRTYLRMGRVGKKYFGDT